MAAQEQLRAGSEIWEGQNGVQRGISMLREHGLPDGMLPLEDIDEFGYVPETGYFWVKQQKSKDHIFKLIRTKVSFAQEVSGFIERKKLKKLRGVKARELLLWVTISEIYLDDARPGETYFKSSTGLGRWHPTEAFFLENQH